MKLNGMKEKEKIDLKKLLKNKALEIIQERINHSANAMNLAQAAANESEKSTAGDKYETSRAMALIDRDIHAKQLESAQKDLSFITQVDVTISRSEIEAGAIAETDSGSYFFLTGLGQMDVENEKIFYLSLASPLGKSFSGKRSGESVTFNDKVINIEDVY